MTKFIEVGTIIMPLQGITAVEHGPTIRDADIMQIIVRHGGSAQLVTFDTPEESKICYNNIKLCMQESGSNIHNCN